VNGRLAVIVPTRGRPAEAGRLIAAIRDTAAGRVRIALAADDDDPELPAYQALQGPPDSPFLHTGPRRTLAGWTNHLAGTYAARYEWLCSMGDDHLPETPGWDRMLIQAIQALPGGVGMAWPDDKRRDDVPEVIVMSSVIARALGYMMIPGPRHMYVDNGWLDLGEAAGCIVRVPGAVVRHLHYEVTGGPRDATYSDAEARAHEDRLMWKAWQAGRMASDVRALRQLIDDRTNSKVG
jgi:hypothetical protein